MMLTEEEKAPDHIRGPGEPSDGQRRPVTTKRANLHEKRLKKSDRLKQEAEEARANEAQKRAEAREKSLAKREKYRRAMAKTIGRNGKKKLGRESSILLEKVREMTAQQ